MDDAWMDGSFIDERTDLGLELELITDAQTSGQDACSGLQDKNISEKSGAFSEPG